MTSAQIRRCGLHFFTTKTAHPSHPTVGRLDSLFGTSLGPLRPPAGSATAAPDEQLVQMLYNQLDDKDEEINKQAQSIARLRQQIDAQDELIRNIRSDHETQLNELTTLQVGALNSLPHSPTDLEDMFLCRCLRSYV